MITSIELKSIVYKIVRDSGVKSIINGDVYIGNRPTNSPTNDIVINALSVENSVLHNSVVLVQIYAKDIFKNETYYPNYTELSKATKYLLPLFKDLYLEKEKTYIDIEYQRDYKVENAQEWVSVIRLQTRSINN